MLGVKPDAVVARITGRTVKAVQGRKLLLGMCVPLKRWTAKEERLLGTTWGKFPRTSPILLLTFSAHAISCHNQQVLHSLQCR